MVALQFWHVCVVSLAAGIIQLLLVITTAAMKSWLQALVKFGTKDVTFNFGAFSLADKNGNYYFYIKSNSGIETLQAMLILTILVLIASVVTQFVALLRRTLFSHGPMFYMRITQILYILSEFLLLIGLSVYTNYWATHIIVGYDTSGNRLATTLSYSSAYIIAWVIWTFFLGFVVAEIIFVNCVLKITVSTPSKPYQSEV